MSTDLADLGGTVVKTLGNRPVLISDVARVEFGIQTMRGDASVNGQAGDARLSIDAGIAAHGLNAKLDACDIANQHGAVAESLHHGAAKVGQIGAHADISLLDPRRWGR